jgi:outer membrane protein TolC
MRSGTPSFPFRDLLPPDLTSRLELFANSLESWLAQVDVIRTKENLGSISADEVRQAFGLAGQVLTELTGVETELEKEQRKNTNLLGDEGVALYHLQTFTENLRGACEAYKSEMQQRFPHLRLGDA